MNFDRRLLQQARQNLPLLALTIVIGFGAGLLAIGQAAVLSRLVNNVFLAGWSFDQASVLLGLLPALIVGRALLTWAGEATANALAVKIKTSLRQRLFQHILDLGALEARGERTGELTSVLVEGIEALDAYFSQYLPQLALAVLTPLTFLLFVFPLDWLSGLVLLLTAPLIPLFMFLIGSLAQALTRRQWQTLSRLSAYFLDVLQGLTTLKMLGRSRAQAQGIAQASERFRQATMSVLSVTFLSALALEMVSTLSTAVVAVEVGLRLLYDRLTFEQAFFVLILAPEFYLPLRLLGARFHAGMSGTAAAKRIFEILEKLAPESPTPSLQAVGSGATPPQAVSIQFEQVSVSYDRQVRALNEVTFSIPAGQRVALVGPSGAGKSTLAALLLRFVAPAQGRVLVNGQALDSLSVEDWRAQVAWVPQNPYLFNDTVAANIRLARSSASLDQVIQAARWAYADEFIRALPQGYETVIGERGARLSGGQAQRIALARAFLKDAPFIILDEATANLDAQHEAWLQESLERLLHGRTALIIAHRLHTVERADQIVVLDAGQVVEVGTHADLLARRGLYARLVRAGQGDAEKPSASQSVASATLPAIPPLAAPVDPALTEAPSPAWQGASLVRLLSFVAPFAPLAALAVLAGAATIASSIGLMGTSAYIISAAALHPSIAELQVAIVGVRFFGVARGVFRYLERYLSHQVTFRLLARLRLWFYQALEPLAPARLLGYHSGDLLARILGDIEALENFYTRALAPPLAALLVGLGASIFLGQFAVPLGWLLLGLLLVGGVLLPLLVGRLSQAAGRALILQRAALGTLAVDSIQGLPDLAAFGQATRQAQRLEACGCSLGAAQRRLGRINALQTALGTLLSGLGLWGVLLLAIPLARQGQVNGVYLATLALAALTSFEAVAPLPQAAQHLEICLQAARRLFEIVDAQPVVSDPTAPQPIPTASCALEVRDLTFRYAPELPPALSGLSFSLPPGKRLALVGPSGAGKSTLVSLLLRFWEYDQGQVFLAGRDLRQYAQEDVRSRIAVVAQNTYLFSASVGDNLRIANPRASQAELLQAAERAQIHTLIQSLPEGYDTWIGEQGLRLSAGERQRLAIARALLRNAPLLILDEATANLDTLTERQILTMLASLAPGRATLMITHRLVGVEQMDEIIVLDGGRVVERGAHADLLAASGLYRRMWDLQHQTIGEEV